ncbi:MAG: class I SAM-dependent rRNA methyltransferase [Rhodocyclaceae bacterium]|nr:class I SAM-dependent rRNA methyltransferase [Rhodocyclaceae bacterium]
MKELTLKPGKERSLLLRHPWLYDTSIAETKGRLRAGETVVVRSARGEALAYAAYSPASKIRARVWTFDLHEPVDHAFFKRRVAAALQRRFRLPELSSQQGLRLIHGESDGLPGVIADRYDDTVVLQLNSAGAEKWREAIVAALIKESGCRRLYEKSDAETRALEGLEPVIAWRHGVACDEIVIEEHGVKLAIDIIGGHKTGFYLDQRENRRLVAEFSADRRVLNCFCYTGGFSLQALRGGARSVLSVDSSQPALARAQANGELNPGLPLERAQWRCANVFEELRRLVQAGASFDFIILDPPKFAPSAAHLSRALRAYRDINLLAFRLLAQGGFLMTFSCSGAVSVEAFQRMVAAAALESGREARIVRRLGAAADHPVALSFPEGEYLKGLLLEVA